EQLAYISPFLKGLYLDFDALIAVGGAANTRELSAIDPARQTLRRNAVAALQEAYLKRTAEGAFKWVGTQYPTDAAAQDAEMSTADYEDFVLSACRVDQDDPM